MDNSKDEQLENLLNNPVNMDGWEPACTEKQDNSKEQPMEETVRDRTAAIAYKDFHELWGKAKVSDNYDKKVWSCLYVMLCQLIEHRPFKL